MPTETAVIGSLKRLSATFKVNGMATDPAAVTFKLRDPAGTLTTYVYGTDAQLVRDSAGAFHVDWPVAAAGRHFVKWDGDGAADVAAQTEFWALRTNTG